MRGLLVGAVFLWLVSTLYFLLTWDWSPDRFIEWATMVICLGGIVLGLIGLVFAIVSGVWTGHQEKKQWE